MKTIRLVASRISLYFTNNKIIFVLFIIGGVACSLAFIYFYGNGTSYKKVQSEDNYSLQLYTMQFQKPVQAEKFDKPILHGENITDVELTHALSKNDMPFLVEGNWQFLMKTKTQNVDPLYPEKGRVTFTQQEVENAERVIVLPAIALYYDVSLGSMVRVADVDFTVIGISTLDDFYIPPTVFAQCGFSIDSFSVLLDGKLNITDNNAFIEQLHNAYPTAVLTESPSDYYELARESFSLQLFGMGVAYIIASLSFMFLMKFMLDRNSRENIIFSIVGASKGRVVLILVLETVILSSCAALFAILLHAALYTPFFSRINIFENLTYSLGDYGIIWGCITLFSCAATVPFVYRYMKGSLIENKNRFSM